MATYFYDFSSGLSGWTEVPIVSSHTAPSWSVVNTDQLQATSASNHHEAFVWDTIDSDGDRDDAEVLVQVYIDVSIASQSWVSLRLSTSGSSRTGYYYVLRTSGAAIGRQNGATTTTIASITHTISTGWYWLRCRINGSVVRLRFWADGAGEPGTWDIDSTDSTYSTLGHVGAKKGANTNTQLWRYFGVGTNGDTAPTSAPSAGAPTLGTASAINITATGATPRLTATW